MKNLRAVLIALHLFAVAAMAFPSASGGMSRAAWKDPTVQDEFAAWNGRLQALGWTGTTEALQDTAWEVVSAYEHGRSALLAPFQPYYVYCGTAQSWRMFVAPHRYPGRLHIDVQETGLWKPIYEARSAELTWRAKQLDHDRFRSAIFRYAWPNYARSYREFGAWVARQVRQDFPAATRVRTRFYRYRTPSPTEVLEQREPPGTFVSSRVIDL